MSDQSHVALSQPDGIERMLHPDQKIGRYLSRAGIVVALLIFGLGEWSGLSSISGDDPPLELQSAHHPRTQRPRRASFG